MSQVPFNTVENITLVLSDNLLQEGDEEQVEFVFAIGMNCKIDYFGTTFTSLKDKICPWECKYRVEDTNLKRNVHFCKIKASLKILEEKNPNEIMYRAPQIHVDSREYLEKDVDYIHVVKKRVSKLYADQCRQLGYLGQKFQNY